MPFRAVFSFAVAASLVATSALSHRPPRVDVRAAQAASRGPDLGYACGNARFWTDGTAGRTWAQARAMCRSVGGDLASIHDEAERVCANRVLALAGTPAVGAWVGLAEDQQEGAWRWSDGTPTDFVQWLPGEPNNDSGAADDCGHLWRDHAFALNDIPCGRTDPSFLCRLPR